MLFLLGGGVIADRLGRRPVMLGADPARCGAQGTLAATVFPGRPDLWVFVLIAPVTGTGEAVFTPALRPDRRLAPRDDLVDANALFARAVRRGRRGAGIARVLVAVTSPGAVIAVDGASYAVSALALASLRLPADGRARALVRSKTCGTAGPSSAAGRGW